MKKVFVLTVLTVFLLAGALGAEEGMMGHKEGKEMMGQDKKMGGGMMGQEMMGCGMMGMMGQHGMMGDHHGMPGGGGHSTDGKKFLKAPKKLTLEEAQTIMKNYLASSRNPNLKLGAVEEKEFTYETKILTKEGSLVDTMLLDKSSGWLRSIY